ncbi:hypothetical protein E2K93_11635 [Thalassotalea sp. HSM 43]|uniref:hypothetical protein n=1 Tax=Thalassotalea sp. HSM 43 TaxID=2552945 RepID=UPI00108229B6|nr:hypothetical protein [Thalassotalea sp. HSM 43]QBY04996.1 hypothetical protein E2K93_11635 [Thalassotalea sp. HSM 43]
MKNSHIFRSISVIIIMCLLNACSASVPATHVRAEILSLRDQTIADISEYDHSFAASIKRQAGYAVFGLAANDKLPFPSDMAVGVLRNQQNSENVFMLAQTPSLNDVSQRLLFVFDSHSNMMAFISQAKTFDDIDDLPEQQNYQFQPGSVNAYLVAEDGSYQPIAIQSGRYWQNNNLH